MPNNHSYMSIAEETTTEQKLTEVQQSYLNTLVEQGIEKRIGSWKKIAVGFGVAFLVVMTAIVGIGVYCIADIANSTPQATAGVEKTGLLSADYLAAVIPLLLALGGAFVAFLGMNRLSNYDTRIDRTRTELLKEIALRIKSEVDVALTGRFIKRLEDKQKAFNESVDNAQNSLKEQLSKSSGDLNEKFAEIDQKYSWLKSAVQEEKVDLDFHTVADAHTLVETLRDEKPDSYIAMIKRIVARICDDSILLSADSYDYHNLAAELARGNLYNEACQVLWQGLKSFEADTDLLADLVQYATKGSMLQDAKTAYEALEAIDRRLWTWRCYNFICDYYLAIGKIEEADQLCDEYIMAMPLDERAYRSKSDVLKVLYAGMEGVEKSIEALQMAIDRNVNCPQCANTLAEMYLSQGQYEEALRMANRAVLELAQEQPHVNVSFVFYNRGAIYDRMFMQSMADGQQDSSLVQLAYEDYGTALELRGLTATVGQQAVVRRKILESYIEPRFTEKEFFEMIRNHHESNDA